MPVQGYTPQVQNTTVRTPTRSANATGASFGAGDARRTQALGAAASNIGQGLVAYGERSQDRRDKSVARSRLNDLRGEVREYMSELQNQKGENALDAYDKTQKKFQELQKSYSKRLENPEQKEYFQASFDSLANSNLGTALKYQESERRNFEVATMDAENLNAEEDAVAARYDWKVVGQDKKGRTLNPIARAEQTIRANTLAKYEGMGKAAKKAEEDAVHKLHTNVLASLTNDSPKAGAEYLAANWDNFNPKKRSEMKAELQKQVDRELIYEKGVELANSGMSLEEQLAEVDKIQDQDKAAGVRKMVKSRHTEKVALETLRKEKRFQDQADMARKNPFAFKPSYDSDEEETAKLLTIQDKAQKDLMANAGLIPAEKSDRYTVDLLNNMTDEQLIYVNLEKDLSEELTAKDLQKYKAAQESLKRGKKDEWLTSTRSDNQMVSGTLQSIGIDPTPKEGSKDSERAESFRRTFQERVNAFEEAGKTKATVKDKEQIIDDMIIEGSVVGGSFFGLLDKDKYAFEVETGEEFTVEDVPASEVPTNQVPKVVDALKRNNIKVTKENIIRTYKTAISGR